MANSRKINGFVITIHKSNTVPDAYRIDRRRESDNTVATLFDGLNFGRAVEIYSSRKLKKAIELL
jgi:hypothetical protein